MTPLIRKNQHYTQDTGEIHGPQNILSFVFLAGKFVHSGNNILHTDSPLTTFPLG